MDDSVNVGWGGGDILLNKVSLNVIQYSVPAFNSNLLLYVSFNHTG